MAESAAKVMTPLLVLGVTCRPDQVAIALLSSLIQHSRGVDASRVGWSARVTSPPTSALKERKRAQR